MKRICKAPKNKKSLSAEIVILEYLRAISSIVHTSRWPPSGGRVGLQLFTLAAQTKN